MEALRATYGGSDSEESDSDDTTSAPTISIENVGNRKSTQDPWNCEKQNPSPLSLPPPQLDLLQPPNFIDLSPISECSRIRRFPHVEGNYSLHVYIPVLIPTPIRAQLALFVKRIATLVPDLYAVDFDYPVAELWKDDMKVEQMLLGREFHISLGRTVPIQVHQIESIVAMLRQKLFRKDRYKIDFNKWDVFVNDEQTRSFVALEVIAGGLAEIAKQIQIVDVIYRLHGLPEFYKDPRPHISLVWGLGDISDRIKQAFEELDRSYKNASLSRGHIFSCMISGIECKIGKKTYNICKFPD